MKKIILCIIFLILSISTTYGIDEQFQTPFSITNFQGGLNEDTATNLLQPNESPNLKNCVLDETNALTMRTGFSFAYGLPVANTVKLLGNFVAVYDDGGSEFIVQAGSGIYVTTGDNVWTCIKNGVTTIYPMVYTMYRGKVWMTNPINGTYIWDRENCIYYSFIPKGRFIITDKEQVLIAGMVDDPSSVRFSNLIENNSGIFATGEGSEDWSINNSLSLGIGDGDIITGLFKYDNKIFITKKNSIWGLVTSDDYKSAQIVKLQIPYGCVSQNSIQNYKDLVVLLDKNGLLGFNGNVVKLSENLDTTFNEIGISNINYGRSTTSTSQDLSTGTWDGCWNNQGSIEVATMTKSWTTDSDFSTGSWNNGSNRVNLCDNEIRITTTAGSGYTKLSLGYLGETSPGQTIEFGQDPTRISKYLYEGTNDRTGFNQPYMTQNFTGWYDGTPAVPSSNFENTYVGIINLWRDGDNWLFWCSNEGTSAYLSIRKIKLRYQWAIYGYAPFRSIAAPDELYITDMKQYGILPTDHYLGRRYYIGDWNSNWLAKAQIEVKNKDHSNPVPWVGYMDATSEPAGQCNIIDKEWILPTTYSRQRIQLVLNFKSNFYSHKYAPGIDNPHAPAIIIWDISAYSYSEPTTYSTATYISPIFDTQFSSPVYKYLYPEQNLGIFTSSGTGSYTTRASNRTDMLNDGSGTTDWYALGSSSDISVNCDGKRYFQWKAELWTSSVTATPYIYGCTLEYSSQTNNTGDTITSTYTSKMLDVGNKITDWGSFIAITSGTVSFEIRGTTYTFRHLDRNATLTGTQTTNWTAITSGDSITISTACRYIQIRAIFKSKFARLDGFNFTWFEIPITESGSQDVASITYKDRYYFAYSTWTTYNTDVLVFDKNGKFTRYDWDVNGFAEFNNQFYILSSTSPYIYKALTGTTDICAGSTVTTKAIDMRYETGDLDFGNPYITKQYRFLYATGKKSDNSWARVETYLDFSTASTTSQFWDIASDNNYKLVLSTDCYGKNIKTVIKSTATNCEIQRLDFIWKAKDYLK